MTCLIWANALFCRNSMQRSRNYLDLILAASCSKLVETESTPEQNVRRTGEDKTKQKEEEERSRRSQLTARRLRKTKPVKAVLSDVPFFQCGTQRLATVDGDRKGKLYNRRRYATA